MQSPWQAAYDARLVDGGFLHDRLRVNLNTDTSLEIAQRFAEALDEEDFASVRVLLADDCNYEARTEHIAGRDAIISSYRDNSLLARKLFDSVDYCSDVADTGLNTARITFVDRLHKNGRMHIYRCQQVVHIRPDGLIDHIKHEELPGERERLREFCASCDVGLP